MIVIATPKDINEKPVSHIGFTAFRKEKGREVKNKRWCILMMLFPPNRRAWIHPRVQYCESSAVILAR
jgi:hypothetical protein